MNNAYFQRLKSNFLDTYAADLCEESIEDIQRATDVAAFIAVLHKYLHFLNFKSVPTADWAREWFSDYIDEANANGVYLDQIVALNNPDNDSIVLLGHCNVNVILAQPKTTYFTLQDDSRLSIVAYYSTCCKVRLKGTESKATVLHKSPYANIKIRKI